MIPESGGGLGGLPAGMDNMRLSQALAGLGQTGKMFNFASKLIKNKDAKVMLNLMAMATGAASTTKDPMALMQTMQGPMSDITALTQEDQQKRLSEVIPQRTKMGDIMPRVAPVAESVSGPGYEGPAYNEDEITAARRSEAIRAAQERLKRYAP